MAQKEFFADYQQETATSYAETLRRIQEAILFIRRQGGSGKIREWQRQSLQLPAFEDSFQEQTVLTLVEQIEELQLQWQKIMKRCKPLLNQKPGEWNGKTWMFLSKKKSWHLPLSLWQC